MPGGLVPAEAGVAGTVRRGRAGADDPVQSLRVHRLVGAAERLLAQGGHLLVERHGRVQPLFEVRYPLTGARRLVRPAAQQLLGALRLELVDAAAQRVRLGLPLPLLPVQVPLVVGQGPVGLRDGRGLADALPQPGGGRVGTVVEGGEPVAQLLLARDLAVIGAVAVVLGVQPVQAVLEVAGLPVVLQLPQCLVGRLRVGRLVHPRPQFEFVLVGGVPEGVEPFPQALFRLRGVSGLQPVQPGAHVPVRLQLVQGTRRLLRAGRLVDLPPQHRLVLPGRVRGRQPGQPVAQRRGGEQVAQLRTQPVGLRGAARLGQLPAHPLQVRVERPRRVLAGQHLVRDVLLDVRGVLAQRAVQQVRVTAGPGVLDGVGLLLPRLLGRAQVTEPLIEAVRGVSPERVHALVQHPHVDPLAELAQVPGDLAPVVRVGGGADAFG